MNLLIKSATVIDPNSPYNNQTKDILILNGTVEKIGDNLSDESCEVITNNNLHISPGLVDMRSNLRTPGYEQHENFEAALKSAEAGGFTEICVMPSTLPALDNSSMVSQLIERSKKHKVTVHPIGAISQQLEGKELAEMFDMKQAGAVAFSDDKNPIKDANLMSRGLLYAKNFDGLIMSFPNETSISGHGQVHEGKISTTLGLEGIPALAEEINASRDLFLANYNEARIHLGPISCSNSVSMIAEAKSEGIKATSDIAAHQLWFTDADCTSFDSNYKVNPPFRSQEHIDDLIEGLKSGAIDVITSDHSPWDEEEKQKEFELAKFGITSLQTTFSASLTKLTKEIGLQSIIQKLSINPRTILQLDIPIVKEGFNANFVLFDPTETWTLKKEDILSKNKNTPFIGTTFTGKVIRTIHNRMD
ncbi:dihydroorotase [Parvicella tangerina]|nr:dihydroorotase [Parvicella tangerina]